MLGVRLVLIESGKAESAGEGKIIELMGWKSFIK